MYNSLLKNVQVIDIYCVFRFHSTSFLLTDQVMHVVFVFLPVFWTLGVLAPVDTFLLYVLEQTHVHLFGGSYTASDIRLVDKYTLSGLVKACLIIRSKGNIAVVWLVI